MPTAQGNVSFGHGGRLDDHYDAASASQGHPLQVRLREAFLAAGRDPECLSVDDIAGIDQLHLGGRSASRALAERGKIQGGERVLDVGCGTGGASRLLAAEYDCDVVGIDITAAFVEVARWLSRATGLAGRTRFVCGDAASVPLTTSSIEVVWCQHALMNMPQVPRVLAEWRRLLMPGGRVLLHEVVAGDNSEPLALPVPWARTPANSHLRSREQLERALTLAGFEPLAIEDVTQAALSWRETRAKGESGTQQTARALPGPALIFGDDFAMMGRNLRDNLAAGKVRVLAGVWQRTGR
ncbi:MULTISPECIES: class I SAM-dependent methyltransferase [unclassified Halomonas]|uniref:class I SAM-dependent methyltransferase n=1 Tax=unclassified Halomonas TaxID=2609666 RepID=UPI000289C225|nr:MULTISPECIES: class I SAM-dependent methyltransferase [unclassified Halomonas]MCE8037513.1 class I SAM-dependent methyltransferase [Halomonas sp. MCCC 1A11062]